MAFMGTLVNLAATFPALAGCLIPQTRNPVLMVDLVRGRFRSGASEFRVKLGCAGVLGPEFFCNENHYHL
jgi:hypothetical protein